MSNEDEAVEILARGILESRLTLALIRRQKAIDACQADQSFDNLDAFFTACDAVEAAERAGRE